MRILQAIGLLILIILVSCLKQPGNHPPVIEAIILDPSVDYTPGSDIRVAAMVTDLDGDPLEYFWESDGGSLEDPLQPATNWELFISAEPLSYETISLTVSDGKETVSKTKTIQVSEGLFMSGYTFFDGTAIPVPGVEVVIGKFSTISDEKGFYSIEHLKEGNTQVTATKDGFEKYETIVYVDNPKSTYNILLFSPIHTLPVSGIIKTNDNITYEGLKVVLLNPDGSESDLMGYTDEGGTFHIPNVPAGIQQLLIRNDSPGSHFLNDSVIYQFDLKDPDKSYDARIKINRPLITDRYMSASELWEFDGGVSDGFYLLEKGQELKLKDFIFIPSDAENATLYLNSYVIGGCDMVGRLPSHRVWISNAESEYLGGISWGGEGGNFTAQVSWIPSKSPTFLNIYGKRIRLHMELFDEAAGRSTPAPAGSSGSQGSPTSNCTG